MMVYDVTQSEEKKDEIIALWHDVTQYLSKHIKNISLRHMTSHSICWNTSHHFVVTQYYTIWRQSLLQTSRNDTTDSVNIYYFPAVEMSGKCRRPSILLAVNNDALVRSLTSLQAMSWIRKVEAGYEPANNYITYNKGAADNERKEEGADLGGSGMAVVTPTLRSATPWLASRNFFFLL